MWTKQEENVKVNFFDITYGMVTIQKKIKWITYYWNTLMLLIRNEIIIELGMKYR